MNNKNDKIEFSVKKTFHLTAGEIAECAKLFSNEYGTYRQDAPHRAGARIRMSADFFAGKYIHENVHIAMAKMGRKLVGQAIYIRKNYKNVGTMTWVLQLVVAQGYRRCGIGSTLLYSIWGMSNDFAWGLATANPCTVKALEGATFRKCDPLYIRENLDFIKRLAAETHFAKPEDYVVEENRSVINTGFFVDNSEYAGTYKKIKDWKIGDLEPGYEWLAFTFRDQPVDTEKRNKHFVKLMEFSEEKLVNAYNRMKIGKHAWARGTENEVDYILYKTGLEVGASVLDVGCAIGRHSIELARRGYHVKGIDNAEKHIKEAEKNLKAVSKSDDKPDAVFEVADIRKYRGRKKYDLVLALFDVIGSYPSEKENIQMLTKMAARVANGGYLAVSVMNMELTEYLVPKENKGDVKNNLDLLYRLKPSQTMQETGSIFNPEYLVIDEVDRVVYRKEQFHEDQELPSEDIVRDKRYTKEEIVGLLEAQGFEVIDAKYVQAGHFDNALLATDNRAKEILVIAKKQ